MTKKRRPGRPPGESHHWPTTHVKVKPDDKLAALEKSGLSFRRLVTALLRHYLMSDVDLTPHL